MNEALHLADQAMALGEVPVGALVVHHGEIVGRGFNQVEKLRDASAHAEVLALRQSAEKLGQWRLNDCTLFVTVEPCVMCAGAIALARVSEVFFGCFEPKFGAFGSNFDLRDVGSLGKQIKVYSGIEAEAGAKRLSEFFGQRRG